MLKKIFKDKKGSAMVFTMVLAANALVIVSTVVFIAAMQSKSSGAMFLTAKAFQRADGGLEYILYKINKELNGSDEIDDICDSFSGHECSINNPEVVAFFLDDSNVVLDSSDDIDKIKYVKVVGEAQEGFNKVSRSLKTTLFQVTTGP